MKGMALSFQPNQGSRGVVCVRPLSSMKHEASVGGAGREPSYPPMMSAGQLLVSHTAALLAGLPALPPSLYHRALLAWPPCPPSPSPPPHHHLKLNNNHIVSSSSGDAEPKKKIKKRRNPTKKEQSTIISPPAPLSPPSSAGSPPSREAPRDKLFTCKVCSRSFGYKHVLQNHERTHTGEKPFECGECHKRFTRDHHLKTHLRLHTGEKPYSCPHCPRHFVQVANLRRHLRVHTGERPYRCELCQARFSDSNQLKAHALIHNGHPIIVFRADKTRSNEADETFMGNLNNFDEAHIWVQEKCVPLVREITFENAEELTEEGLPFLILFHSPGDTAIVKKYNDLVLNELLSEKQSINFLTADGKKFEHPLHHLGKGSADLPLIAIDSFRHMYLFPDIKDMDVPGKLKQFLQDLYSGKLHREFHYGPEESVNNNMIDSSSSEKKTTKPPESAFKNLAPSKNRYTLLRDEL